MDTPFIENSSDVDASFDSAHIEKICFCIKIRALVICIKVGYTRSPYSKHTPYVTIHTLLEYTEYIKFT